MAGSISQFKSSFSTDVARPNRFDVIVPVPIGLVPYIGLVRRLNLRCEAAELPGRTIATTNMKIYGVEEKFPYMTSYSDISLTFIVGDDMREKKLFDAWLNWINPSYSYDIKYKADYTAIIRINQYDVANKNTYSVDLMDAFPVAVNPLSLDWQSDGYHKLTVTFAYTNWRNNSLENLTMEFLENQIYQNIPPILPSNLGQDSLSGVVPPVETITTDVQVSPVAERPYAEITPLSSAVAFPVPD